MTTLRTAARQALEALEADCGGRCNAEYNPCWQREAAETLRAALAEPVQEPVAWSFEARHIDTAFGPAVSIRHPGREHKYMRNVKPLYTAPPQRKPLTETSAERTLKRLGYTDCGGEFWKPPLGAPAEPVQESAICDECGKSKHDGWALYCVKCVEPMFAPPQRKPLTREEAIALWADKSDGPSNGEIVSFARAIERAHGIGGNDE